MTLQEGVASQKTRVGIVKVLLIVAIALDAIAILSGLAQRSLLNRAAGFGITDAEAAANDARQALIGGFQVLVYLVTVIFWLRWLHRAYSNLQLMGIAKTDYSPGWSVGCWFVPIMNLFRPYQVTKELWLRSARSNKLESIKEFAPPTVLNLWWGLWLATNFLGQAVLRVSLRAEEISELQTVTSLQIGLDAANIVSAALALVVISNIDVLQRQAASISSEPPSGAITA